MAYTGKPSDLFGAGYAFSTPDISISNVANPSISDIEADATTGDYRRILYGLLQDCYGRFAGIPTADKPGKMTFVRNSSPNDATQTGTVSFTIRFTTDDFVTEVADEV